MKYLWLAIKYIPINSVQSSEFYDLLFFMERAIIDVFFISVCNLHHRHHHHLLFCDINNNKWY